MFTRINEKVANFSRTNGIIVENNILSAYADSGGSLWFGTFDGNIIRYNPGSGSFRYVTGFDCKGIEIHCFFEDRDKNIWIGTNKGLHVYSLITRKTKSYYTSNSGITDNVIRAVTQDNAGNIWIGTFAGEICIFDRTFRRIRRISPNKKLYGISQLYRDSQNHIWAATGENLFMFRSWNDNRYKTYGIQQGLADNFINAVTEGWDGRIWCSTNSGISCLNLRNNSVKNFNRFDGVPRATLWPGQ